MITTFCENAEAERSRIRLEIARLRICLSDHERIRDEYREEIVAGAESLRRAVAYQIGCLDSSGVITPEEISAPYDILMGRIKRLHDAESSIETCKDSIEERISVLDYDDIWLAWPK
jgi:hypothetical protein